MPASILAGAGFVSFIQVLDDARPQKRALHDRVPLSKEGGNGGQRHDRAAEDYYDELGSSQPSVAIMSWSRDTVDPVGDGLQGRNRHEGQEWQWKRRRWCVDEPKSQKREDKEGPKGRGGKGGCQASHPRCLGGLANPVCEGKHVHYRKDHGACRKADLFATDVTEMPPMEKKPGQLV